VLFRGNLAVYADYAGDFQTGEQEAAGVEEPSDLTTMALAFAQIGQGRLDEARGTYAKLRAISARGASWSAAGMGDLALYEGNFSEAAKLFEQTAAADVAAKSAARAARRFTSLAYVQLLRGKKDAAIAAAEKALATSKTVAIRFLAARTLVEAGAIAEARPLGTALASELAAEPQAYGKIIEGEIALKSGDARQAVKALLEANGLLDTWLGHYDLGRAYLELGAFPQADSEFERCIARRGEALSVLLDEEPTFGYFPTVYYYKGRVREALHNSGFADSYREYLKIRGKSTEDPLLPEVRKRAGA
jgi:eukaryotic-like serine/threonine-protein kinase